MRMDRNSDLSMLRKTHSNRGARWMIEPEQTEEEWQEDAERKYKVRTDYFRTPKEEETSYLLNEIIQQIAAFLLLPSRLNPDQSINSCTVDLACKFDVLGSKASYQISSQSSYS